MHKKKVSIIGTNGLPGRYGGWDQLMHHLVINLKDDYQFSVYTSTYDADPTMDSYHGAYLPTIPLKANGPQSIPYDIISMIMSLLKGDQAFFVFGVSGGIFFPFIKIFSPKIILNPDGAEWKRDKFSFLTKKFLKFSEALAIKYADVVVTDNKVIQKEVLDTYGIESNLIEYGGDNVIKVDLSSETALKYEIKKNQYAFKVCRIVPENNIDIILEAFAKRSLKLVLVGNWNFSNYGTKLREKYKDNNNLLLLDPIYEQNKIDELRSNCGIYIHGHSVGGTNPSLVEAMNLRLCCFVYGVNYNIETTENKAIYFYNSNDLNSLIDDYEKNKIDTNMIGQNLYDVARKRYTWKLITNKYKKILIDNI